jgi:Zn-finger nucleic acid-binding protein
MIPCDVDLVRPPLYDQSLGHANRKGASGLKCPIDGSELQAGSSHGVRVARCPACHGMWIERADFERLEDEAFELDEHAKGTLVFDPEPTDHPCPECGLPLELFSYRAYDLPLEICPRNHGLWLDDGEDARVLELMRREERSIDRSMTAEDRWRGTLRRLRSGSFLERIRELFR